jgi:hypothetical protein
MRHSATISAATWDVQDASSGAIRSVFSVVLSPREGLSNNQPYLDDQAPIRGIDCVHCAIVQNDGFNHTNILRNRLHIAFLLFADFRRGINVADAPDGFNPFYAIHLMPQFPSQIT